MDVVRMRIEQTGKEVTRGESIPGRRSLRYP